MVERGNTGKALGAHGAVAHRVFGIAFELDYAAVTDVSQNSAVVNTCAAACFNDFCFFLGSSRSGSLSFGYKSFRQFGKRGNTAGNGSGLEKISSVQTCEVHKILQG